MTAAGHSPAADFLANNREDMFTDVPLDDYEGIALQAPAQAGALTFQGMLVRNAEVRTTTAADGLHSQPVVCLELRATAQHDKRICMAHIPFTDATRSQAEAVAKAHTKGMVVTVSNPALQVRMTLPQAHIINAYTPTH